METIAIVLAVVQLILFWRWIHRVADFGDELWFEPSIIALLVVLQVLLLN